MKALLAGATGALGNQHVPRLVADGHQVVGTTRTESKQALLEEAGRLVRAGMLREEDDVVHLTFQELRDVVRSKQADDRLIQQRKVAFSSYEALTPPRVLTSDGEVIAGAYRRDDVPAGALVCGFSGGDGIHQPDRSTPSTGHAVFAGHRAAW